MKINLITSSTIVALLASSSQAFAYNGFNDCQRYTGLSNADQKTYQQSRICVPVANLTGGAITVTLYKSNTQGDTRTIFKGNVGEFTHSTQVKRGTSYNIVVKTQDNKIIYDSRNGKDPKAVNLIGLICAKSITAAQAAKTIDVIPKQAKFGPPKCVAWTGIKPKSGFGPD